MNRKIFLCDDNLLVLQSLELVLSLTEATIVSENRSTEALEYILQEKPDIFICDLEMPVRSGEDLIKEIRSRRECDYLFIICVSASSEGRAIALNAGADYFLPKPFAINELLPVVTAVLTSKNY